MRSLLLPGLLAISVLLSITGPLVAESEPVPDLYNLGPLGGKADAVTAGLPDGAKSGLKVREVYDEAPAESAGLKPGDVIYGAGETVFTENAYLELGDAILDAEADADEPTCLLKIRRGKENVSVSVSLRHYADEEARRSAITKGALSWLAERQDPKEGGFHSTISPEVSQVVLTSLAGLAWLASGSQPGGEQKYSDNVDKAIEFVIDHVGEQRHYRKLNGKNNNQTNWGLGYGGIFLAHALKAGEESLGTSARNKLKRELRKVQKKILKQTEPNGGFAAGPGGENILGYINLEIVSNFCLAALGCMKQVGIETDAEELQSLVEYVESCQMPDGGIGYAHDKKWFSEVGRTAGAMNAFASLGEAGRDTYPSMQAYFEKRVGLGYDSHSTPTMHVLSVAIAAQRHGLMGEYWKTMRREMTMVRNPDNTFAYRPTADTARLGMNLDRDLGLVWTTAQWALVLSLEGGGCPLWVGSLDANDPE